MNKLISKKKGLCFLLAILCALCMFFACGALCYRASAAEGEKLGVNDSVYGWEIATQNNLEFSQNGEWARFKETTPTIGANTIDVIFNRNGFDISQPIEFKIKADAMAYSTDDGWLGFFLCKDLTTHQLSPLQGNYLAIDIWYLEKDPYIRCRIGTSVVGAGSYLGNATVDPTVPTDGTYILKITVTDAHTEVSLRGNGHERKFTISEITSSYFTNGKLYLNSRFHNNTNAGNYDISFSKVKNGLPVKYVIKGVSNTQRLESIEAESFTLAAAPEMPEGRPPFAGWRASDGKVYAAGAQYTPTEEEKASDEGVTFYAVSDASAATVALEYESVVYDGSVKQPAVSSVTLNGQKIPPVYPDNEQRKNYSVTYSDNTMPGTASATITFEGFLYTGSVTKNFTIEKIAENQAGDNLVFTCSEATYAKMTTESALGADYTYTVKDEADEVVTAQTKLIAGEYAVTAVKTEETKVTTVTYTVTVNKDVVNTTGTNFELEFAEATYVKMTTESTLGTDYTYTVKNAAGEAVAAETKLAAGAYTVTAVKETATTIETVTYTVTVGKELINTAGDNLTFALADATYEKMTTESALGAEYTYTVKNGAGEVITAQTTLAAGTYNVTAVKQTATSIETITYTVTLTEADSEDPPADEPKSGCGASAGIAESGVAGLVLGIGLAFVVGLKKRSQKH